MLRRATSVGALILAAALALPSAALAGPMTPGERQRLIAHLQMTEDWLVGELEGLSDAQLTFKMTPESWSIKDVAEHLAIAEPQYWTNLEASLKEPVKSGWKPEATDEQMLWYGIDRTNRQRTGEARVPHGQFAERPGVAGVVPQAARDDALDGEGVAGGLPRPHPSWAAARTSISGS